MKKKVRYKENIKRKKALSPVVSTVLLIVIVIVLAIIIFIWATSFWEEKVEKFDRPVERACSDVNFDVAIYADDLSGGYYIDLVNNGVVPIQKINLKTKKIGTSKITPLELNAGSGLGIGQSTSIELEENLEEGISEVLIVPILLGKSGNQNKEYTCDDDFAVECIKQGEEFIC